LAANSRSKEQNLLFAFAKAFAQYIKSVCLLVRFYCRGREREKEWKWGVWDKTFFCLLLLCSKTYIPRAGSRKRGWRFICLSVCLSVCLSLSFLFSLTYVQIRWKWHWLPKAFSDFFKWTILAECCWNGKKIWTTLLFCFVLFSPSSDHNRIFFKLTTKKVGYWLWVKRKEKLFFIPFSV
jgi:hypothetical protein